MKFINILLLFTSIFSQAYAMDIIPTPKSSKSGNGQFVLTEKSSILSGDFGKKCSKWMTSVLKQSTGYNLELNQKGSSTILLKQDKNLPTEGYSLKITPKKAIISASTEAGLFYGCQSFFQLLPAKIFAKTPQKGLKWVADCVEINDTPKYQWRGLMLDISRHFFGADDIKDMIDWMAMHKLNRLHLHLTDSPAWRIEIKGYPKLTTIGATGSKSNPKAPSQFLTQKEIKKLVKYAKSRHITIVPEIDMPGHFGAAARAYPELDGGNETLNVTSPATEKFLDAVFTQIGELFESPYIHYGSDEVRYHHWDKRPDMVAARNKLGLKNQKELEAWFDRKVAKDIIKKGYTPVAWDEASDFGIDKRAIVQWWRCLQPKKLNSALENGYKVIISPPDFIYFDYPYSKKEAGANWEGLRNGGNSSELIYNWQPVPQSITEDQKKNILGLEACIWTESIKERKRLEYMIFPRMAVYAEQAWGHKSGTFEDFGQKFSTQIKRYKAMGVNYRLPNVTHEERKERQPEGY